MKLPRRVPLESAQPAAWFAVLRVAVGVTAIAAELVFDVPHRGALLAVTAGGLVWALLVWAATRLAPRLAVAPAVAFGDLAVLAIGEAIVPEVYAATRFLAVFMIAAHAHIQGPQRGMAFGLLTAAVLIPIAFITQAPIDDGLLAFYETLFAGVAVSAGTFFGRMRVAESTGRLRAREISRRVMAAEGKVRRNVAQSIHDGPVQELTSMDMMLTTAERMLARGEDARARDMLGEIRGLAERTIGTLRDEIVSLGPYGLEELTLDASIEECAPTWSKRYGVEIELALERLDLPSEVCGGLFGIAQEAVANAGRHARAARIWVDLRRLGGVVELRVRDDGSGFEDEEPLAAGVPGHIGLASMRERAELLGGTLAIESDGTGTVVTARVPEPQRGTLDGKAEHVARSRVTP